MPEIEVLRVPKWGLSMEEGTVTAWLIAVGDSFEEGQEICEIESSKIANVLEAPFTGTLRKVLADVGATLPVQGAIGLCADATVPDSEIDAFARSLDGADSADSADSAEHSGEPSGAEGSVASRSAENEARVAPTTAAAVLPASENAVAQAASRSAAETQADGLRIPDALMSDGSTEEQLATPRAWRFAQEYGITLARVEGTGRRGRVSMRDIENAILEHGGRVPQRRELPEPVGARRSTKDDSEVASTPAARRLAREVGVNLHDCTATGRKGRVTKDDVEVAAQRHAERPDGDHVDAVSGELPTGAASRAPLTAMRRTIAKRLQQSKREAPHFRLTAECVVDQLLALRNEVNAGQADVKVSVNDFVVLAAARALVAVPQCNVQFDGSDLLQFQDADVAVAVALESGLITPIIRAANRLSLLDIARQSSTLAEQARAGRLRAEQIEGGTLTVSNLGMFGVKQFDAIINPPQVGILAVGCAEPRVIVADGQPSVASCVTVTLSADHRVIDGAAGAQFLQAFTRLLQTPGLLLAGS
jgi:pyruvate dehydrogenase E2 component (dihydrolipoamide acetyltransferase)